MAALVLKQLFILLWKSWIMRKRHWISAIFEIVFPLLLVLLMEIPRYSGTAGAAIPEPAKEEGWQPPTYFDNTTKNYAIDSLFTQRPREDEYNKHHRNRSTVFNILFTPNNTFTDQLMQRLENKYTNQLNVTSIATEDEMFATLNTKSEEDNTYGVVFLNDQSDGKHLRYKIRMKDHYIAKVAELLFPVKHSAGPAYVFSGSSEAYEYSFEYDSGPFVRLQIALNEAFLDYVSKDSRGETVVSNVTTHQMPYPKYIKSESDVGINLVTVAGTVLIISYIVICPLIVKRIADEKVAKAKEMLKMMGLSDWVFWGSHFINFFSVMLIQSAVITLLLFVGIGGWPYFLWSNGFIFFISIILFNISSILSSMLLTTVFNRPVVALVVSVILFAVSHTVPMALLDPNFKSSDGGTQLPDTTMMALTCFLPNSGLQWMITLMANTEVFGHGVSWNNMWDKSQLYGNFTVGYVMLLQFFSIFFYALLIWYVDNIWPFQFGIPKPFYFPFQPSYWFSNKGKTTHTDAVNQGNPDYFEKEPTFGKVGIECHNLHKVFNKKVAVSDVSLNVYSGQITVLLGHNGAGKTTTMNMITGIFPPTNGTAFIDGYDVRQQTKEARRSMALCPQENILYNELNVWEHLKLYAVLKDHPWDDIDNEVEKTLEMVGLSDKRLALSTELSGGMKRKLCLGIAMIANSQILVLDEPTSGMDPEARRHMWDVLQSIRAERTILLTTHYMEEADALGDRIAIMSDGSVKCCGTPMFLKKTFGAGYHLRIAKNPNFEKERVLNIIRNYMTNADIKSEIHSEIVYSLENENQSQNQSSKSTSALLSQLFTDLESRKTELSINSCGLTVTTMEDVFLRVGNEFTDNEMVSKTAKNGCATPDEERLFQTIPKNYGSLLLWQQFKALLYKRFHYAKRYWPMIIMQMVLPSILFMCILLLDYSMKKSFTNSLTDRTLNLKDNYGNSKGFVRFASNQLKTQFKDNYQKSAESQSVAFEVIDNNPNNWTIDGQKDKDFTNFIKTYLVGSEINATSDSQHLHLVPWYNKEASHTLPASINLLYQTLLNKLSPDASISAFNHPVPVTGSISGLDAVTTTLIISCLLLVPLTVPFIGASYVLFPIHERVSNSKLLQLMNGISITNFWGASYLFDIFNHMLATIILFIVFLAFDFNKVFIGSDSSRTALFFLFFLFGFASIPLAYLTSLRLKKASSGYALLVIIYLITGLILVAVMGVLDLFVNTYHANIMSPSTLEILLFFSRILPVFSMSFGIQKIYKVGSYQSVCHKLTNSALKIYLDNQCETASKGSPVWGCCQNKCSPTGQCYNQMNALDFSSHGVGIEFLYLSITGIIYLFILWLVEGNFERILYFFERKKTSRIGSPVPDQQLGINMNAIQPFVAQQDSDVLAEKQRVDSLVETNNFNNEAIVVKQLSKTFGRLNPIQAVNRLSFAVHKEECFGLLGVNGAGKTTTFKMLTGDETVSGGNAFIQNYSLREELKQFQKQIGYCPQFDALLDKMTGSETLFMFCRLRGMPEEMIEEYVTELVQMVDLNKYVNKCTETYSGGNRRKLSLAIALCAAPPVIFLDEPTSGVDPSARRKIWSTLATLQERYGSAFVLTSHSMEECEALCSRLAIMVNGEFQCFGSVQHLRTKFGQGFTIIAKLRRDLVEESTYMSDIQQCFRERLPSSVLKDVHQCLIHYHIADTSVLWSTMFAVMEEIKTKFLLEDYIISDTTLEQIFLAFARKQR